jgi:hypothetical protein
MLEGRNLSRKLSIRSAILLIYCRRIGDNQVLAALAAPPCRRRERAARGAFGGGFRWSAFSVA